MPARLLRKWADSADVVFAADAGLDLLLDAGKEPDVVVGDFDSSSSFERFVDRLHRDESKESTDADKLLALADSRGFRHITLASVEGDQVDHMLATLHSAAKSTLWVRLALRTGLGWVLKPGDEHAIHTVPGRRVSLLPLEEVGGAHLAGVEWPVDGLSLHPTGATSISNRAIDSIVIASIESGSALLFVGFPEEEIPVW
jgi:thiamine pyrophosphokinase